MKQGEGSLKREVVERRCFPCSTLQECLRLSCANAARVSWKRSTVYDNKIRLLHMIDYVAFFGGRGLAVGVEGGVGG